MDYSVSFKQYIEYLGFDFDTTIETENDAHEGRRDPGEAFHEGVDMAEDTAGG